MTRSPLSSLRYRLLLLVLLAVLPALGLIISTALEQRRQAAVGAQDDALRLARLAAGDQERLIEGARSLLIGLAQLSTVQMHNSMGCSALFAEVQRRFPLYINVGAIRPDGQVFCAARSVQGLRNLADQPFFQRAMASRDFAVSDYSRDPATSKPVLTLSYPAIDSAGSVWAVVFAELDLGWMAQLAEKAQLPAGSVITVNDVNGWVLARYPDPGDWTGKSAPDWALVRAIRRSNGEGTLEAAGLEGIPRLTAFTPLLDPRRPQPVYVSVGIPRQAALAEANRLLIRNLVWTGLVVVLMLVAAAIVSDLFILRRVSAVVRAARQLTAGDLSARAEVGGADEIGVMARTFNVMAGRLQARVSDEESLTEALADRVNELDLLNRMGELFQASLTLEEAYAGIGQLAPRLFPNLSGAVYAFRPGNGRVEPVAAWGPQALEGTAFAAEQCWALRDGRSHVVENTASGVLCQHLPAPAPAAYLCTPLVAQGNSLGVLYVAGERSEAAPEVLSHARQRLAEAVAAQLGLGLANVELRELLRRQSIHDPLTGLFNRRYMEETLEREVHRSRRNGKPMSLLMVDLDRFKQQNDAFGHDAGDALLRDLAALLQSNLRKEDIACRYGGEEFVLVLPDASLENATRRAEQLRAAVKEMRVVRDGVALGPITISVGVAAFPEQGPDGDTLLKAADAALYQAKNEGRDRVSVAKQIEQPAPST
ncbi:MAG TPA: diguanylate cyclase [Methylomirabilota bacterium]|nr:diguanylate cyclase [Methylomirabilota bacterium]